MAEQKQMGVKLTNTPFASISREMIRLCSKEQQKRFAEYEKLGLVKIIDNDAGRCNDSHCTNRGSLQHIVSRQR